MSLIHPIHTVIRRAAGAALVCMMITGLSIAASAQSSGTAPAGSASTGNSQQDRMKACNAQATTQKLAGDARKSFMSDCLSGKPAPAAASTLTPQQQKMKDCNAQAGTQKLSGDARKAFMASCLKG
jgi:hypothetical protein